MSSAPILDADTKKELSDGEHVASLIESTGWNIIFDKLKNRLLDLQNINNLITDGSVPLETQLLGRKMAVDEIWAWLNSDVFGYAKQQEINAQAFIDKTIDGFIDRG